VSLRATRVRGLPENYFDDWVARHYEVLWPHLFDPEVVEPAVSFLAGLAGDGRWPSELDLMARLAGMALRDRWSDWNREPFTSKSRSHISVWQKPE
jgi:hypothetical protein